MANGLRQRRGTRLVGIVSLVAASTTAVMYGIPQISLGYPLPGATFSTATITSICAFGICFLFAVRQQRTCRRTDYWVACLFGVIAIVEGLLPLVAEVAPGTTDVAYWSRVIARTVVALGLCAAAWAPERSTRRCTPRQIAIGAVSLAALTFAWTLAWASHLPATVDDATDSGNALLRNPSILTIRLGGAILLFLAAFGFVRKSRAVADPLLVWLACGAVLMGTARFHDFLFPSLHNDWVTTGDLFRMVAEWVILGALCEEVSRLWELRGAHARRQEQRRIIAELHDGLAQELACVATHSALAELEPLNRDHLARVRAAANRALTETRSCIEGYANADPLDVDLDLLIARLGREVEQEYGCRVVSDLEPISVRPRTAHELGRVAREAMINAARHGHPDEILVHLDLQNGRVRLSVADDGAGIGAGQPGTDFSFGLTSMRQRAERLGGHCSIVSAPYSGTKVAIDVPQQ